MNMTTWVRAMARGLVKRACCACIERCGVIAGNGACGAAATALFFDDAAGGA